MQSRSSLKSAKKWHVIGETSAPRRPISGAGDKGSERRESQVKVL